MPRHQYFMAAEDESLSFLHCFPRLREALMDPAASGGPVTGGMNISRGFIGDINAPVLKAASALIYIRPRELFI